MITKSNRLLIPLKPNTLLTAENVSQGSVAVGEEEGQEKKDVRCDVHFHFIKLILLILKLNYNYLLKFVSNNIKFF